MMSTEILHARTVEVNKKPHLCLFAVRDIQPGEEITYSYGDSDWPWRAKVSSTESSDKSPVSSLDLQKLFHQAPPVSSSALYKVYINEPHKQVEPQQSGKASTSENKMKLKDCHERFNRAQIKTKKTAIEPSQEYFMPSSPVMTTSSSSSPVQPSSPVKTTSSSSSPVHPSTPLPCAASTPVISSSQVSETLSLMEMHSLRQSRKRQYSGSAYSDSDVTDYSDVDYIPQISSDESDGSASGQSKAERSSDGSNNKSECSDPRPNKRLRHTKSPLSKRKAEEAGSSSAKCMTAMSSKRMKCQTEETETSSDKKTLVQSMPSPQKKSRSYNKKQYCLYCSKPYAKMARHLEFVHRNEVEVAKAVAFPKRSKERRVQLNLLRKRGNFAHNTDVVRKGEGEMIACYRPKKCKNPKEFIHCIHCQGLYNKLSLWNHSKNCPLKPKDDEAQGRKRVRSLCALKTPVGLEVSKGFKKVLSLMNYDEVSRVIHSDRCIMQLGEHMFNRMGSDVTKHDYIRQKMREVGRLLLEARRITPLKTMEDFMIPANFKHVISAVKVVSGFDEEKNSYRIPSLALKLGHSLKKICSIVESNAMMYGDHERAECARDFRKVHQARWN
ncbi:uncharacterized protein [Misgurnus anguillicaudatus]|uniref:uncharacterized protein n=1 Tax=Misgurnus anguillicaudatus TaxID=75329 RepID=UPI003CCF96A8